MGADKSEGWRWLERAGADRRGVQLLFDGASYHLACFVAQQAADQVWRLVQEKLRSK